MTVHREEMLIPQGKETEHNWTLREKSVIRLRGMLRGQAHKEYQDAFLAGLKNGVFEGISRTIVSAPPVQVLYQADNGRLPVCEPL